MNSEQLRKIIINQLDLEGLPPDMVGAILISLTEQSLKQFMIDAYDALKSEDQKELKRLIAQGDSIAVRAFVEEKLHNIDSISLHATQKIIARYKKLRLEMANAPQRVAPQAAAV